MSYVRFKGCVDVALMDVKSLSSNLVQIYPPEDANVTAGFELLTKAKGGKVFGSYLDFNTIYRKLDDGSVILSNDGSVYEPPVYKVTFLINNGTLSGEQTQTPERFENLIIPEVAPAQNYEFVGWSPEIPTEGELTRNITFAAQMKYIPTLEEVKVAKKAEISVACENIIHAGIDVKVGDEWEHFSLKTNDQINLFGKQYQLASGATQIEYHQDGCPCKYYSAEDMQEIIAAALKHVSYHTTYCNSLNMWIAGATSEEEVEAIYYGADIPEKYQSEVLKDYRAAIMAEAESAKNESEELA